VKEVDGRETKAVVLSRNDVGLVLSGIYYARAKDYYAPRKKSYELVHVKIAKVAGGVIKCFG